MQLEELKLLSTAENLGVLSLLERGFETDPGAIAAYSIPPLIGTIGRQIAPEPAPIA